MPSFKPVDYTPDFSSPSPAPLSGPGMMPPGTVPGRVVAQEGAPDASMVPLSAEAQDAQEMLPVMGMMGDRAGVMSYKDILDADPTYQGRLSQNRKMGEAAAVQSIKQQAGKRAFSSLNQLEQKARAWYEHAPSAFNGAIGPWNSNNYVQDATGFTNRGAQAAHTMFDHDIEKLTAEFRDMPSSGANSQGSDAQDLNFKNAMGKWMAAPDADTAFAILQSAKDLVRQKGGLPDKWDTPTGPLDSTDISAINRYAATPITPDSPYVTGIRARPESIKLLQAHPTPDIIQQFNDRYGAGAAEKILGR